MPTHPRRVIRVGGWLAFGCAVVALHIWPSAALYSTFIILITTVAAILHTASALRSEGRMRLVWSLAAVCFLCWAIVEVRVGLPAVLTGEPGHRGTLGNLLNLGGLGLAVVGMLALPGAPPTAAGRLRMAFDGVVIGSALLGAVWMTVLRRLIEIHGSVGEAAVDLAYPILGVVLLAVALLLLAGQPLGRINAMSLLTAGIVALTGSLIVEVVETVTHRAWLYPWVHDGYLTAAVLIGIAPLTRRPARQERAWQPASTLGIVLPYLPVVLFVSVGAGDILRKRQVEPIVVWVALVMLAAVLGRNILSVRLNAALTRDLAAERTRFAYEAAHDALTGLPNRAMLTSALRDPDLQLAAEELSDVSLLMLDLDGFKLVNDTVRARRRRRVAVQVADRMRAAVGRRGCARPARRRRVRRAGATAARPMAPEALAERLLGRAGAPLRGKDVGVHPRRASASPTSGPGRPTPACWRRRPRPVRGEAPARPSTGRARPSMRESRSRRVRTACRPGRAVDERQLTFDYQPIVDLGSGAVRQCRGTAALAPPGRGMLATGSVPRRGRGVRRYCPSSTAGYWRPCAPSWPSGGKPVPGTR